MADDTVATHVTDDPAPERLSMVCPACGAVFAPGAQVCPDDNTFLEDNVDSLVGTTLGGQYRVEAVIGRGGMGVVLRARHAMLHDKVAIKLLPSHVARDPVWLARFQREGQAARRFRHPAAVAVHDLRVEPHGLVYLVMEFVEGRTLKAELNERGRLSPAETVALLAPIAGALDAAHAQGVVHRDLKPENIMVVRDGTGVTARLLDLGIAAMRAPEGADAQHPALTSRGILLGTPLYMSPEQWGEPPRDGGLEIDGRADVYALGLVVYEMVSGAHPFQGVDPRSLRRAHVTMAPPLLLRPEIPEGFARAVARAMAKDRDDRFATPGDLFAALAAAVEPGGPSATRVAASPPRETGARPAAATVVTVHPPHNLPLQVTSFVDSNGAARAIGRSLAESRLVTLVGPGGIGKTRLSIEAAARALGEFPGGVWLVELAATTAPETVARAAAAVLGVHEPPDGDLTGALCREVGDRRALFVLDNCEHVVDAAAALAGRLLLSCPNVRIVASSREPLGIAGEHVWPVTTLSAPDPGALPSLGELGAFDAIRLFADRARTVQPSFELTEQNAPAIARLCSRLDGIPLAIEIAAARSRAMGVEDLVARLDDRLGLLVDPGRSRPPRHRTLRSAIEWSYDLLPEDERALFRRLSVFAGGWALDAAEAAFPGALDPLEGLVAKSLVVADTSRGRARYSMYETVREYARERLEASGEAEEALDRHEAWTVALVDEFDASALTPRQNEMRARLRLELDNVRAVLVRTAASPERGATLVRLGAALGRFWESAGLLTEGREWLARAAACDEATVDGSKVLFWSGVLAIDQGDYQAAASALDVALALSRALDDRPSIARTLRAIGFLGLRRDDEGLAVPALEEAIELYRAIGDRTGQAAATHVLASFALVKPDLDLAERLLLEIQELHVELGDRRSLAIDLYSLAEVAVGRGDFERARQVAAEAVRIAEELDDTQTTAYALHASAGVACDGGEPERALAEFRRALELDRRLGDEAAAVFALEGVASALAALGHADAALRLAGAAAAVRAAKGYPLSTVEAATLARRLDPAFAAVADPEPLLAEGRRMGLDAAVASALTPRSHER